MDIEMKARAIASYLGGTLRQPFDNNEGYFTCTMPDGVKFGIRAGGWGNEGRISFCTAYPYAQNDVQGNTRAIVQRDFDRELPYNSTAFSGITVSADRTADSIGKEVVSRFLKVYEPLYKKAEAYCEEQAQYYKDLAETTQAIKVALFGTYGIYIKHFSRHAATLEINASPALATEIANVVRNFKEKEQAPI